MRDCLGLPILGLLLVFAHVQSVEAQFGEPPGARMFRMLDTNEDAFLEGDEWNRMPTLREFVRSRGIDTNAPITFDEFVTFQEENGEEMRSAVFGGGFGPGPGGVGPGSFGQAGGPDGRLGGESDSDGRGSRRDRGGRSFGRSSSDEGDRSSGYSGSGYGGGYGMSRGGDRGGRSYEAAPASSSSTKKRTATPRKPVLIPLPEKFADRDANRDGQIGLYEWPRENLAEFAQLDRNSDGFLTPLELTLNGPTSLQIAQTGVSRVPAAASTTPRTTTPYTTPTASSAVPVASRSASPRTATPVVSPRTSTPTAPRTATPAVVASTATDGKPASGTTYKKPTAEERAVRTASWVFDQIDRDKDGSVTVEEFGRSRTVRPLFQKAGQDLKEPMAKDDFVKKYIELSQN